MREIKASKIPDVALQKIKCWVHPKRKELSVPTGQEPGGQKVGGDASRFASSTVFPLFNKNSRAVSVQNTTCLSEIAKNSLKRA